MTSIFGWWKLVLSNFYASICFYTCLPLPYLPNLEFKYVSRWAPIVGLLIGSILGACDLFFNAVNISFFTSTGLLICIWLGVTGGLHLDGAMDAADGLAVTDPQRRLEVMSDSATGAFGAMVAIAILILKTLALLENQHHRGFILVAVCGWARWGQLLAIWRYPYLKETGKGAFHKQAINSPWHLVPNLLVLITLSVIYYVFNPNARILCSSIIVIGVAIAACTGAWFNHKLGGHTGDTYGAVVEWTETLMLCMLTPFSAS